MKPGSQQTDEADQCRSSAEHQARHNENETETEHSSATPLPAFKVVPFPRLRKRACARVAACINMEACCSIWAI